MGKGAAFGLGSAHRASPAGVVSPQLMDQDSVAARFEQARHVVVVTGVEVGQSSGLPDLRNPVTGEYPDGSTGPVTEDTLPRVWGLWDRFRRASLDVSPSAAHYALAGWEQWVGSRWGDSSFTIISLNVDGLHQQAGSRNVIELHGSVHEGRCLGAGHAVDLTEALFSRVGDVPRCPRCSSWLRPSVTLVGERPGLLDRRESEAALQSADFVVFAGTPEVVSPTGMLADAVRQLGVPAVLLSREPWVSGLPFVAGAAGDVATILPMVCPGGGGGR